MVEVVQHTLLQGTFYELLRVSSFCHLESLTNIWLVLEDHQAVLEATHTQLVSRKHLRPRYTLPKHEEVQEQVVMLIKF